MSAPTPESLALRAVAAAFAARLVKQERCAVALTGSAARGNAGPASDVDLWVLGATSGREHLVWSGTPLTLLRMTPREALRFEALCFYEVDDLLVLEDARGAFAQVQRAFARQRPAIRRAILEATLGDLHRELGRALEGSTWQRVVSARAAGLRLACLWLFLRTGWRVPRLSTLQAQLPRPAVRALRSLLGLPARPAVTRAVAAGLPALQARAKGWLARARRRGYPLAELPPLPRELDARLRAREFDEALVLARRWLRDAALPLLLRGRCAFDVASFAALDVPRGTRATLLAAEGLVGVPPWDAALNARVGVQLRALTRALRLGRALSPPVQQLLAALWA